ncbi:DUF1634 domain-containing protein [Tardisphaera miroshnichenkoae]
MKLDVEKAISYSLIGGVIVSSAFVIAGLALIYAEGGAGPYSFSQISSFTSTINSKTFGLGQIVSGLSSFNGISYIYLGIMVLIATPVVRVGLLVAQFVSERNRLYLIISVVVLVNLVFALLVLPRLVP